MKWIRFVLFITIAAGFVVLSSVHAQNTSRIPDAFERFWSARSPAEAEKMAADIVNSGISFDDALKRLKAGRTYAAQKTGVVKLSNHTNGIEHFYALNVPPNYDPARKYQVRFQLHGGVGGRESNQPRGNGESPLPGAEQIYVVPYAWSAAPWWSDDQVSNLSAIVDSIKRTYNIDENRVVVAGVSDGGTGAYYIGMRDTTPYASFLPLNGFIMVIANDRIDDGAVFPNNLRNKPMFAVNGGKDPLYPTSTVEPFVKHLMTGVDIEYHPQPDAGHNTAWWPELKDTFEKFVQDHPRDPHPEKLTWETTSLKHNRAHWLIIDQLGMQPGESPFTSNLNLMRDPDAASGAVSGSFSLFSRPKPPGRVDLVRTGNTVQAATKGVAAFTLLLSTDEFDFSQPVKVMANGRRVFEGPVTPNLKTLMKWAARDNDRTMLYGAELEIRLGK